MRPDLGRRAEGQTMELVVLMVPDCPNAPVLEQRLAEAMADRPPVSVVRRVIDSEADARRWGMRGSPTLLVNGVDPFAQAGMPASLSCRIFRDDAGRTEQAPSVAALRAALDTAAVDRAALDHAAVDQDAVRPDHQPPTPVWSDPLGRAGRGRVAPAEGGLRAVYQQVLRSFAHTGRAPGIDRLDEAAAPYGVSAVRVLAELHAADFLRLDSGSGVRAAYPFSAVPTAHRVRIDSGPSVFAMCAIDALGIAPMLRTGTTITSADPDTGQPITVTMSANGDQATWTPATVVVFAGQQTSDSDCRTDTDRNARPEPPVAADVCCGHVNFFASARSATSWAETHPEVTGDALAQADAIHLAAQIFGPLLLTAWLRRHGLGSSESWPPRVPPADGSSKRSDPAI